GNRQHADQEVRERQSPADPPEESPHGAQKEPAEPEYRLRGSERGRPGADVRNLRLGDEREADEDRQGDEREGELPFHEVWDGGRGVQVTYAPGAPRVSEHGSSFRGARAMGRAAGLVC